MSRRASPSANVGLVWGDARGLRGGQLADQMLRVAGDYGFDDAHAGVAITPVAAEVAATQSTSPLVVVKPGQDRAFIAPYKLDVLSPPEHLGALLEGLGIETCGALRRARRRSDRGPARRRGRAALAARARRR